MYYYHTMDNSNGLVGIVMTLMGFLFLVIIVAVAVRLWRGHDLSSSHRLQPLDLIKERYAKGEMTKAEFDQVKQDLAD